MARPRRSAIELLACFIGDLPDDRPLGLLLEDDAHLFDVDEPVVGFEPWIWRSRRFGFGVIQVGRWFVLLRVSASGYEDGWPSATLGGVTEPDKLARLPNVLRVSPSIAEILQYAHRLAAVIPKPVPLVRALRLPNRPAQPWQSKPTEPRA